MRNKKKKSLPLPHDLIVEILSRLPVKSLVRFRCVSKSWLSLSSDPQFAKSHFELAASPSHRLLYISASDYRVRSIDLETSLHDDSAAVNLLLPLPNSPDSLRNFRILGSCRGFILLANYSNLIIWNPLTGVHKRLPYSPIASKFDKTFEFTLMYGLGYDASTDDYLIVTASFDDREADWVTRLELFSVRSNSWKEIEGSQFPYTNDMVQSGLLFNGAIHWLAFRHDESVRVIVAFDLIQKNLTEVPLPDCDLEDFLGDLWIVGGCLGLFYWRWGENKTEMWVMKEYKVRSSWTKYDLPWSYIAPMYTAKGGELVAYAHRGRLMKFNDAGQLLEQCTYCDDRRGCILAMYRESLLSLPTDCGEAREDEQQ